MTKHEEARKPQPVQLSDISSSRVSLAIRVGFLSFFSLAVHNHTVDSINSIDLPSRLHRSEQTTRVFHSEKRDYSQRKETSRHREIFFPPTSIF